MRQRFDGVACSVARAVDEIGDRWVWMVLREAFLGTRRFADFQRALGVSRNVLTERLDHLVARGILERVDAGTHGVRFEYALTPKGKDLLTVLTAMRQWGDRWISGEGQEPVLVIDRRTGRPIPRVRILGEDGAPIPAREIELQLGPGANADTRASAADRDRAGR